MNLLLYSPIMKTVKKCVCMMIDATDLSHSPLSIGSAPEDGRGTFSPSGRGKAFAENLPDGIEGSAGPQEDAGPNILTAEPLDSLTNRLPNAPVVSEDLSGVGLEPNALQLNSNSAPHNAPLLLDASKALGSPVETNHAKNVSEQTGRATLSLSDDNAPASQLFPHNSHRASAFEAQQVAVSDDVSANPDTTRSISTSTPLTNTIQTKNTRSLSPASSTSLVDGRSIQSMDTISVLDPESLVSTRALMKDQVKQTIPRRDRSFASDGAPTVNTLATENPLADGISRQDNQRPGLRSTGEMSPALTTASLITTPPQSIASPTGGQAPQINASLVQSAISLNDPAGLVAVMRELAPAGNGEQDRVVVQLDPPELGRISIDFKFDGQTVQAISITGENPEALRRLRLMHFELVQALADRGLSEGGLSYQQGFYSGTSHQGFNGHGSGSHMASDVALPRADSGETAGKGRGQGQLASAALGAIDIRL